MQSDAIEDFCEADSLSDHLDVMFGASSPPLEWDTHQYVRDRLRLYYLSYAAAPLKPDQLAEVTAFSIQIQELSSSYVACSKSLSSGERERARVLAHMHVHVHLFGNFCQFKNHSGSGDILLVRLVACMILLLATVQFDLLGLVGMKFHWDELYSKKVHTLPPVPRWCISSCRMEVCSIITLHLVSLSVICRLCTVDGQNVEDRQLLNAMEPKQLDGLAWQKMSP